VYGLLIIGVIVLLPGGVVGGLKRKTRADGPTTGVTKKAVPAR
jgi:hypothetical protein